MPDFLDFRFLFKLCLTDSSEIITLKAKTFQPFVPKFITVKIAPIERLALHVPNFTVQL